jgi:hypothetical protein
MSDIFIPITGDELKKKIRTKKITIHNPYEGEKKMVFRNEERTLIDNVSTGVKNISNTVRSFDNVITETITITDPVTQQEITMSVAGIATAIEDLYVRWWNEDNPS